MLVAEVSNLVHIEAVLVDRLLGSGQEATIGYREGDIPDKTSLLLVFRWIARFWTYLGEFCDVLALCEVVDLQIECIFADQIGYRPRFSISVDGASVSFFD
eukprot:1393509-Amorphochlora_amoeboformis.AAC.1